MDALRGLMEDVKRQGLARGQTLGLLHLLIGRSIRHVDGAPICLGLTWRQAATLLKKVRWPKETVRELGLEPTSLPPRDRVQFWYVAISQAQINSPQARQAGDTLAQQLAALGYQVS